MDTIQFISTDTELTDLLLGTICVLTYTSAINAISHNPKQILTTLRRAIISKCLPPLKNEMN